MLVFEILVAEVEFVFRLFFWWRFQGSVFVMPIVLYSTSEQVCSEG